MRSAMASAALAVLLLASGAQALSLQLPKNMDGHKCKVMCQRFGMKALAKANPAFAKVHDPTTCCTVCDKASSASPYDWLGWLESRYETPIVP